MDRKETLTVSKKLLALMLCLILMLGAVGCLEENKNTEAAQPAATDAPAADTAETDELPAFKLGDFTVTVGEVRSSYNTIVEYMGYYGMAAPSTAEEIQQYRDMIIEDLLNAKVLPWKAKEMGVELTEEKKEQVAQEVEELVAGYAADYLEDAKAELGEDADAAAIALKAREILEQDVADYFGYPFEQWLSEVTASYEENALTELLQEKFNETVTVTEEQARAWFDAELIDQQTSFDADYAAYKTKADAYALGEDAVPALYTPEGFAQMQVITFDVDEENSAAYAANELEMTNLEAEYGKLYLRGLDEDRQAEIMVRYGELLAENTVLLEKDRDKAERARADALAGQDFTEIFNAYSNEEGGMGYYAYAEGDEKRTGVVTFYTLSQDAGWPQQVWEAAVALKEGEVSELLQIDDSFYLIKRLNDLPAGSAAFEDDPEAFTAAALADKQAEEWDAVQEDWTNEARNAAEFFEENYAGVGL